METQEQKDLIRKHPNYRLIFMNEDELREELKDWTREQLISWLCWNDPNGLYKDEDGMAEVGRIMTYEEGVEYIVRQVRDGGVHLRGNLKSLYIKSEKISDRTTYLKLMINTGNISLHCEYDYFNKRATK